MKQKLEKELLQSLDTVKEYLTKSADFASEQAPLVVEELIRFNLVYSGVVATISGIFLLCCLAFFISVVTSEEMGGDESFAMCLASLFFGFISAMPFSVHVKTLIMCLTAPRLFVIEYLRGLM